MITIDQLDAIMPFNRGRAERYLEPLNAAMDEFEINTPKRQSAFLAQLAHESGEFLYVREIASGEAYEGRADLGNTEPGDGVRFKGRGLIQITGRANYAACAAALGADLITHPELLEAPDFACRSAAWFWKSRGLNELADESHFREITRRINGGYTHYERRLAYFNRAEQALA